MTTATFDERSHCVTPGWATYHGHGDVRCTLLHRRHVMPSEPPVPANGHSPSNYAHCTRCDRPVHWYVEGQHRWGGIDRYFADLGTP